MKIVTELPRRVREIENLFIELGDGCRLAARVWLPDDAEADPVPAILEYLPYRKRDGTSQRDALTHPYVAGHGYACLRVDMRGNGESDGLMLDEYAEQEQDDALEVIDWIARQPWCTGAVGMIGISWGGFNGLQVAARQPPALKAVITLCSTDDRYADDIHFMGGCLLNDNLSWASTMLAYSSRPPDPALLGERWREHVAAPPRAHGAAGRDMAAPPAAGPANGSMARCARTSKRSNARSMRWAAGRTATPTRSRACSPGSRCQAKGLIGPWAHKYPHFAHAWAADRLPAGMPALVGSVAEGHRYRHHGRAGLPGVDAGERAAPGAL